MRFISILRHLSSELFELNVYRWGQEGISHKVFSRIIQNLFKKGTHKEMLLYLLAHVDIAIFQVKIAGFFGHFAYNEVCQMRKITQLAHSIEDLGAHDNGQGKTQAPRGYHRRRFHKKSCSRQVHT